MKMFLLLLSLSAMKIDAHIEYDLHMHLFANYSPSVRPVKHRITPTIVKFNMKLMRIIAVEEKIQTVTSQAYFSVKWDNEFMRWNPQRWGNVRSISVRPETVWIPDVILKNNANSEALRIQRDTETVWISYTGECAWFPKVTIMSSFRADVTYFPFDSQNFIFHFGSWSFDEHQIKIDKEDKKMLDKHYLNDSEWDLVSMDKHLHRSEYDNAAYSEIIFTYFFSRKPAYSVITAIVPSIGLMSMALFSYLLPPDLGERIAVLITSLLAFTVFLVEINGSLPRNSDSVPIVQVFYMVTMAECILCFIVSCVLARLVSKNTEAEVPFKVPTWMRKMMTKRVIHRPDCVHGFSKKLVHLTKQFARKCSDAQMLLKTQPIILDLKNKTTNNLGNGTIVEDQMNNNRNFKNNKFKNNIPSISFNDCNELNDSKSSDAYGNVETGVVDSHAVTWGMFAECMDKICIRVFSMFFLTSSVGIFVAAYLKQSSLHHHFLQ